MRVDAGRGKLYDAQKVIRHQWDEVSEIWNDTMRVEFEEKIWEPLDQFTSEGMRAIDRLSRVFTECRRACSGEQ